MKPELTGKLSNFIAVGKTVELSYYTTSILQKNDYIEFSIRNILSDYEDIIKTYVVTIDMSDKEYHKYCYKPELLAYDLYGSTDMFFVLLYINNICDRREFRKKRIKVIPPKDIGIINQIFIAEYDNLRENRYQIENPQKIVIPEDNRLNKLDNSFYTQEHIIYYGNSNLFVYNDDIIKTLHKDSVYNLDNLKFNINGNKYIYFIAPSSLGLYKFTTETITSSILTKVKMTKLKQPDTGLMINYNVFRSTETSFGDQITVSLTK